MKFTFLGTKFTFLDTFFVVKVLFVFLSFFRLFSRKFRGILGKLGQWTAKTKAMSMVLLPYFVRKGVFSVIRGVFYELPKTLSA
jgi:hypothetical protein